MKITYNMLNENNRLVKIDRRYSTNIDPFYKNIKR